MILLERTFQQLPMQQLSTSHFPFVVNGGYKLFETSLRILLKNNYLFFPNIDLQMWYFRKLNKLPEANGNIR